RRKIKMTNKMLLNLVMTISFILPLNVQFHLAGQIDSTPKNAEAQKIENLLSTNDFQKDLFKNMENRENHTMKQTVTLATSATSVAQNKNGEEQAETKAQTLKETIKKWKGNFPTYKENSKQVQFIQTIAPAAVLIADQYGIYPSVMIAQAALESSWGQSELATNYNNLMGTKGSWEGETVKVRTREDIGGESVYIHTGFSVYDSWSDSLYRYGHLMRNVLDWDPEYYQGTWRENTTNYQEATEWLQGRYATDRSYAEKLKQTIQSFNLDQYDHQDSLENFDGKLENLLAELNQQYEKNYKSF